MLALLGEQTYITTNLSSLLHHKLQPICRFHLLRTISLSKSPQEAIKYNKLAKSISSFLRDY